VHGVEDEMRGDAQAVMLHYAVYLGVLLIASNVNSMCNNLYGIIIILFHDIPGIKTCTCAYVTHSNERFVRDCEMIQQ
jgi:hypothetical protein